MIAILDYGSGNIRSAHRAFELADSNTVVTKDPQICANADGLVVPGVGAFSACIDQLLAAGGGEIIAERINSSDEKGKSDGLGILKGEVSELDAPVLPHIGWNNVSVGAGSKLFQGIENSYFYFVHSYAAKGKVDGAVNSYTQYGQEFLAAVEFKNIVATQFHPEKSGEAGAILIKNWVKSL